MRRAGFPSPKNPKSFNPATNPENLLKRRNHVLALMRNQGYITDEECTAAQAEPITLAESKSATEKVTRTSRNSYFDDALFVGCHPGNHGAGKLHPCRSTG